MRTLAPLTNDFRQFDEIFDRLMGHAADTNASSRLVPVDVAETNGALLVRASLPGVEPEAISVQVEKDVLTIRAERKADSLGEDAKVYRRENAYGVFVRSLRLSDRLDTANVTAESKNGVLTLTIPRLPEEKPKTITVNVARPALQGEGVPTVGSATPGENAATEAN